MTGAESKPLGAVRRGWHGAPQKAGPPGDTLEPGPREGAGAAAFRSLLGEHTQEMKLQMFVGSTALEDAELFP